MAAEGGDDDHISPSGSNHLAADDILRAIVTTLEDIVGLDRGDQLQRRVLFEYGNGIDKGKGLPSAVPRPCRPFALSMPLPCSKRTRL